MENLESPGEPEYPRGDDESWENVSGREATDAVGLPEIRDASGGNFDGIDGITDEAADNRVAHEKPAPRNSFVEAVVLVMTALLLALTLKTYVAEAYEIKGSSMMPTFRDGQRVVVLKAFYDIERGDVIIFTSTENGSKDLIKRVIGLPGEKISIQGDQVYVDGRSLDETYVNADGVRRHGITSYPVTEELGPDEFYVLGDNRGDSHDSRRFHGVPSRNIKGKVVVRWWPVGELRSF